MTGALAAPTSPVTGRRPIETVLLATDLSAASEHATERAIEMAVALGARLLVLNILEHRRLDGYGSHARVDQARAEREGVLRGLVRRARDAGARCEYMLWAGEPSGSIVAVADAESADLIVAGTHGRALAGRLLLGSVSEHLVRSAPCPVMVVRPD
jgi:nucleotide-binding universal stress UspA family protein